MEEEFPADPTIQRTFSCCLPCLPLFVFKFFCLRFPKKQQKSTTGPEALRSKTPKHHLRFWHMKIQQNLPKKPPGNSKRNYIWVFPKIWVPPKSSILIGFSIINHSSWGSPIFGNIHIQLLLPKKTPAPIWIRPFWNLQGVSQYTKERRDFFVCGEEELAATKTLEVSWTLGRWIHTCDQSLSQSWPNMRHNFWDISDIQTKHFFSFGGAAWNNIWNYSISEYPTYIDSTLATYTLSTFLILLFQCKFTML